jgi:hypothetical protein
MVWRGVQGYLRVAGGKAALVAPVPVIDQFADRDLAGVKRQIKDAKQK